MIGTLLDVCWWLTKGTCSGLSCLALPAPPDPTEQLKAKITQLEIRVQQLEEKSEPVTGIEDFDILPVVLTGTQ